MKPYSRLPFFRLRLVRLLGWTLVGWTLWLSPVHALIEVTGDQTPDLSQKAAAISNPTSAQKAIFSSDATTSEKAIAQMLMQARLVKATVVSSGDRLGTLQDHVPTFLATRTTSFPTVPSPTVSVPVTRATPINPVVSPPVGDSEKVIAPTSVYKPGQSSEQLAQFHAGQGLLGVLAVGALALGVGLGLLGFLNPSLGWLRWAGLALLLFGIFGHSSGHVNREGTAVISQLKNNPTVLHYSRPQSSVSIDVKDFLASDSSLSLKSDELQALKNFLDAFPASHLTGISAIVNANLAKFESPIYNGISYLTVSGASSPVIVFQKIQQYLVLAVVGHEIGHQVQFNVLTHAERQEWDGLYNTAMDPTLDFLDAETLPSAGETPYGAQNPLEDFASVYGNWTRQSGSVIYDAVAHATAGFPRLLQKTLFVASLFENAAGTEATAFSNGPSDPIPFARSKDQIILGNTLMQVSDGKVIALGNVGDAQLTALKDPFDVPTTVLNRVPETTIPSAPQP